MYGTGEKFVVGTIFEMGKELCLVLGVLVCFWIFWDFWCCGDWGCLVKELWV